MLEGDAAGPAIMWPTFERAPPSAGERYETARRNQADRA
jgi:hypothetical protein